MAAAFTDIPAFSLARWRAEPRRALAEQLVDLCHHVGFFHLVDHGVDDEFQSQWHDGLQRFFALPEALKATIDKRNSRHFRGWERVGAELTDNRVDYREQFDASSEHPPLGAGVEPAYLRLYGPNQWLGEDVLPGFRALIGRYFRTMGAIANDLMSALSVGLGLPAEHLGIVFGEHQQSNIKLISYPPTPPGEAGVNAHHDAGFLTILRQHGVGGLQARNPDGRWIDIEPRDDAYVINLGEMLQAMTGNYLVATMHRVIATEARLSSAYFHGPDLRMRLDPLPLDGRFAAAVAASPRHAAAGFMAKRDELMAGRGGTGSESADTYGQQLWNYYVRSYPDNVAAHYGSAAAGR